MTIDGAFLLEVLATAMVAFTILAACHCAERRAERARHQYWYQPGCTRSHVRLVGTPHLVRPVGDPRRGGERVGSHPVEPISPDGTVTGTGSDRLGVALATPSPQASEREGNR